MFMIGPIGFAVPWLLLGLMRSKVYQPLAGWGKLLAKVVIASALLGLALVWLSNNLPWLEWRAMPYGAWQRILSLFGIITLSSLAYSKA